MSETTKNVIIIGLDHDDDQITYELAELAQLVRANGLTPVLTETQKRPRPDPATYFGKGKVAELAEAATTYDAEMIVTNDELSPSQIRNLEAATEVTVVDRTGLILDIFAQRAQTKLAQQQVQLARLSYQLPRLRTSMSISLDQQTGAGGGGFTSRGAGETKLEQSRRRITSQMVQLRRDIAASQTGDTVRAQQRRDNHQVPKIALVGYTNAGKSTLLNALIARFEKEHAVADKQVFAKDMLFATLSTTVRHLQTPNRKEWLLSDTVGFVSKLPHALVDSFRTTLSEAREADLLVHVIDVSDPHAEAMQATTEATLKEIGVVDKPTVIFWNKADRCQAPYPERRGSTEVVGSARDTASQDALFELIEHALFPDQQSVTITIPLTEAAMIAKLQALVPIAEATYTNDAMCCQVVLTAEQQTLFAPYLT